MVRRYLLFILTLSLFLAIVASVQRPALKAAGTPPSLQMVDASDQRITFSHRLHIEDIGVDCLSCHPTTSTSKFSSESLSATHESCMTCHEEQLTNTCGYCHTDPDNIGPAPAMVRDLKFSHEQHLGMKDTDCQTCHKGVDQANSLREITLPAMATCSTCHNDVKATNTCEACHTNFASLIPKDHQRSDFLRNHRDVTRLGGFDASCQTCHTETTCMECHQSAGLKAIGPRDRVSEPGPKRTTRDSDRQTILQNVHELNYRFTHGIDAKARKADCASCHTTQTFCAHCHEAGGNITQQRFKPASHSVPGFTMLARGSGGGLHAEEARRDIESCASCHDVEGRDPTCLTCHTTDGRIR